MFKPKHVVYKEYFNWPVRVGIIAFLALGLLIVGFSAGLIAGILEREYNSSITKAIELRKSYIERDYKFATRLTQAPKFKLTNTNIAWSPSKQELKKEIECLALNIYFEARGDSLSGQVAVGLVTINRLLSEDYPETICDVVWEKRRHPITGKWVGQFSWTQDGIKNVPRDAQSWIESKLLAHAMLAERDLFAFVDITEGATHYHTNHVDPWWNEHFTHVAVIDSHLFYRDEDSTPWSIAVN